MILKELPAFNTLGVAVSISGDGNRIGVGSPGIGASNVKIYAFPSSSTASSSIFRSNREEEQNTNNPTLREYSGLADFISDNTVAIHTLGNSLQNDANNEDQAFYFKGNLYHITRGTQTLNGTETILELYADNELTSSIDNYISGSRANSWSVPDNYRDDQLFVFNDKIYRLRSPRDETRPIRLFEYTSITNLINNDELRRYRISNREISNGDDKVFSFNNSIYHISGTDLFTFTSIEDYVAFTIPSEFSTVPSSYHLGNNFYFSGPATNAP